MHSELPVTPAIQFYFSFLLSSPHSLRSQPLVQNCSVIFILPLPPENNSSVHNIESIVFGRLSCCSGYCFISFDTLIILLRCWPPSQHYALRSVLLFCLLESLINFLSYFSSLRSPYCSIPISTSIRHSLPSNSSHQLATCYYLPSRLIFVFSEVLEFHSLVVLTFL